MTDLAALAAPAPSAAAAAFLARAPHGHLIGGEWVATAETFDTLDPATGKMLAPVAKGNAALVDSAVSAARVVEADYLKSLPVHPRSEANEAEALRIKARVLDLMHEHGGVHFQIGKVYPFARDHDPAHWALLKALKAQLDPKGILAPGNLGL